MAITSSAKKAIRSSARKRVFNVRRASAIENSMKKISKLIAAGKTADAKLLVPAAYKAIDKAVKTNYVRKNTAARMKSRLMGLLARYETKK